MTRLRTIAHCRGLSRLLLTFTTAVFCVTADSGSMPSADRSVPVLEVDCDRGGRLVRALRRAKRLLGPVEIEIRGICEESVLIDRPQLTLRGADPAADGIRGDGRLINTLMLDSVWNVRIENLSVYGLDPFTRTAVGIGESFGIRIVNCQFEGTLFGAIVNRSNLGIEASTLLGGSAGLRISSGGGAFCDRCTLSDGGLGGRALVVDNARITVEDSSLEGTSAVVVGTGGSATVRRSSLRALPNSLGRVRAITVFHASRLVLEGSSIEGAVFATDKSLIRLDDVTQRFELPGPESHGLRLDSVLRTLGSTTLEGDLALSDLGQAILTDGTALGGDLICDPTSEAWCLGGVSVGGSNCAKCPTP